MNRAGIKGIATAFRSYHDQTNVWLWSVTAHSERLHLSKRIFCRKQPTVLFLTCALWTCSTRPGPKILDLLHEERPAFVRYSDICCVLSPIVFERFFGIWSGFCVSIVNLLFRFSWTDICFHKLVGGTVDYWWIYQLVCYECLTHLLPWVLRGHPSP